jgi:glyoxylase-like metal-dependent hydrolase (beta-lactamase superfamily II)
VPGHALDQVAVVVEGVLIAADGLFSPAILAKHPIIFLVSVAEYLNGLDRLALRSERYVVPGHGEVMDRHDAHTDPLPAILEVNRAAVRNLQKTVLAATVEPGTEEEVLYRVLGLLQKEIRNEPQYFLDRAAVAAHTSHLIAREAVLVRYSGGRRLLQKA